MDTPEGVTLTTLGSGAALELWQREWERVLENIMDPNTDPKATRAVTLTVTVKPDENREAVLVSVDAKSKLTHAKPHTRRLFVGHVGDQPVAVDHVQYTQFPAEQPANVTPIGDRQGVANS